MDIEKLKFYSLFSLLPFFKKNYVIKIMSVALCGILVPVFTFGLYLRLSSSYHGLHAFLIVLLVTLIVTPLIVYLLNALLRPIVLTSDLLHQYISEEQLPKLPISFEDTVGRLMADVQYITEKLDLLNRSSQDNSNIDPLTGIQNRRAGEECLRQDLARARRDESQMLVAMIDIDGLANINEQFGHHIGDVCLTQIAELLSKSVREGDWVARWGGDVFFMMLWNFNHASPLTVLERIHQQLEKTPMGKLLQLSLSMGACQYRGDTELDTETDLETLLIRVDEALSKVKEAGGGGIFLSE